MKSEKKSGRKVLDSVRIALAEYLCAMVSRNGDRPLCELDPRTAAREFMALCEYVRKNRVMTEHEQKMHMEEWIWGSGPIVATERLYAIAAHMFEQNVKAELWNLQLTQHSQIKWKNENP